jgi:Rrf2 family iron-sulfur cluster assembly transcriptional regulator
MGLRLTQAGDYAVRAMIHLASLPDGTRALREDIARAQDIPSSFMAKILRSLVNAGLLRSCRGVRGGFSLSRPASEINLLEVVEAVEGRLSVIHCVPDPDECELSGSCGAHAVWSTVQHEITDILGSTKLRDLTSPARRQRARA